MLNAGPPTEPHQLGHGDDSEFLHDTAAMDFDRVLRDPQLLGGDLHRGGEAAVEVDGGDVVHGGAGHGEGFARHRAHRRREDS